MAVWQYKLHIIPKKGVVEHYGKIPSLVFIDHQSWENYWDEVSFDGDAFPDPDFEDALTRKCWSTTKVPIEYIVEKVDACVKRAEWDKEDDLEAFAWKGNKNLMEDHDAFIAYDTTHEYISEFQFRVDLRNRNKATQFLRGMLRICQEFDWLVFNVDGELFPPEMAVIFENIQKSRAVHFLTDPEDFFDTLETTKKEEMSFWNKIQSFFKRT